MTGRTAATWLVIAGVLGALYLWMSARAPGPRTPDVLRVPVDPARVAALTRTTSDGVERVVRGTGRWDWLVVWDGPDGAERRWAASDGRVRSGLRTLTTAPLEPREDAGPIERATVIEVALTDGGTVEIALAPRPIAGRTAMTIEHADASGAPRRLAAWAPAELAGVFGRTGFRPWRDDAVLTGSGPGPDTVRMMTGADRIVLRRARGGWVLAEPIAFDADDRAVGALLGQLAGLRAADFADGTAPDADVTGLAAPGATIELATAERPGEPSGLTRRLRIGSRADIGGTEVFAAAEADAGGAGIGPVVVRLVADDLAPITIAPQGYVRRTVLRRPATDVGRVAIGGPGQAASAAFQRTRDGWAMAPAPAASAPAAPGLAESVPAAPEDAGVIDALLGVLADAEAGSTLVLGPGTLETPIATIELFDQADNPMLTLALGTGAASGRVVLATSRDVPGGRVVWIHGQEGVPAIVQGLARILERGS